MFGSLWMKILLSLQHPLSSKQQIILNFEAKNTTQIAKEFRHISSKAEPLVSMELLSHLLVPHSTPNDLGSFNTIVLPFLPNLTFSHRTSQSIQFSN